MSATEQVDVDMLPLCRPKAGGSSCSASAAVRDDETHPAPSTRLRTGAPRHKEETCLSTEQVNEDTFPLSLQGGDSGGSGGVLGGTHPAASAAPLPRGDGEGGNRASVSLSPGAI